MPSETERETNRQAVTQKVRQTLMAKVAEMGEKGRFF
jgi:hypothetical protein